MKKHKAIIIILISFLAVFTAFSSAIYQKDEMIHLDMTGFTPDMINDNMHQIVRKTHITETDIMLLCEYGHQLLITGNIKAGTCYDYLSLYLDIDVFNKLYSVSDIDNIKNIQQRYYKAGIKVTGISYSKVKFHGELCKITVIRQFGKYYDYITYFFSTDEVPNVVNIER